MAKTRNPQDATLRNIRALKTRVRTLEVKRTLDRKRAEQSATAFTRFQVWVQKALTPLSAKRR